jgi:hypothetical protein
MAKPDKDAPSDVYLAHVLADRRSRRSSIGYTSEGGHSLAPSIENPPTRYPNRRGSFVMIPSTPIALSLAI